MLSHRLATALPSRPARILVAVVAYLAFAAAVVTSTLYRDEEDSRMEQAEMAQYLGGVASSNFDFASAERYYRASIESIRACNGERDASRRSSYAEAHEDLADVLKAQGRLAEAEAVYRRAVRFYEQASGRGSESLVGPLSDLGEIYSIAGRDSAARACASRIAEIRTGAVATAESEFANFRKAAQRAAASRHDVNHLERANRLLGLGQLHLERRAADRAEIAFAEAYEIRLAAYGPRDYRTVAARGRLGQARAALGKFTRARADLEAALAGNQGAFGPDFVGHFPELTTLGAIGMSIGDYAAADSCFLRMFLTLERRVGREHWCLIPVLEDLSECRLEMGQFAVARGLRKRIMRIHTRALGAESYAVGVDLLKLAEIEERAGAGGWARASCSAAVRTLTAAVGPRHETTVEARLYLRELWVGGTPRPLPRADVVDGATGASEFRPAAVIRDMI